MDLKSLRGKERWYLKFAKKFEGFRRCSEGPGVIVKWCLTDSL